jgi:hypothetical protein
MSMVALSRRQGAEPASESTCFVDKTEATEGSKRESGVTEPGITLIPVTLSSKASGREVVGATIIAPVEIGQYVFSSVI